MTSKAGRDRRADSEPPRRRWPRRLLFALVAALAGTALSFVVAPTVVRRIAENRLTEVLGRQVTVERVRVNPFTLSLTIENVRIAEADGQATFLSATRVSATVDGASLFRHALIVQHLRLESLRGRIIRERIEKDPLAGYNFSDIVRRLRGPPSGSKSAPASSGVRLSLADLRIGASTLTYEDRVTDERHAITELDVRVPLLSTLPEDADVPLEPTASLRVDGAELAIRGRVKPWKPPVEARGTIRVSGLKVKQLGRGFPVSLPFVVAASVGGTVDVAYVARREGAWKLEVTGRLALERLALRARTGASLFAADKLDLILRRARLEAGAAGPSRATLDVELDLGRRGRGAIEGTLTLHPLVTDLRFRLRSVDLTLFASHLDSLVGAHLTSGALSATGTLGLALPAARAGGPTSLRLELTGDGEVTNLASLGGRAHEPLVSWSSARVAGLALTLSPVKLVIRQLAFDGLAVRVVRRSDRTWSFRTKESGERGAPARRRLVVINDVTVRGGTFNIEDRSVRPAFTATVSDISARVSGLSSKPGTKARVQLSGTPTGAAAVAIGGHLNALEGKPSADFEASVKDYAVSRLNPYIGKYAGYLVDAGSLDLMVTCHLEHDQLSSTNRLVITGARLGEHVESDRATKLPLPVAVALLKSRRGVIDLVVPVNGSFADDSFHLGRAIGRALRNVIIKTAASPFTLIAKVFGRGGDGDELSYVDFPPGGATLDVPAVTKLRTLASALREHEDLSLEIEGRAAPDRDRGLGPAELAALASRRAAAVRDDLVQVERTASARIIVAAPKVNQGAGSRVQLRVKED